ncbi:type II toxin-antitoxin system RelB/DinJ family antitoxin [Candidatus Shapirobacteria bacterium]|nr:type II toxin-antitoxin system RelB/DinJ family antitoxin [Candidatus Shapirobacteria bacterium]
MKTIQKIVKTPQEYLQVRIDSYTKNNVSLILSRLGMTPSQAIKMLFSQIIIKNALPFEVSLPANFVEKLSPEESAEVGVALEQIKNGEYTEVDMNNNEQVKKFFSV